MSMLLNKYLRNNWECEKEIVILWIDCASLLWKIYNELNTGISTYTLDSQKSINKSIVMLPVKLKIKKTAYKAVSYHSHHTF